MVISQVLPMETTVSHMHDLIAVFLQASRPPPLVLIVHDRTAVRGQHVVYMYSTSNM
jgi:hypothetical protein